MSIVFLLIGLFIFYKMFKAALKLMAFALAGVVVTLLLIVSHVGILPM